MVRTEKAFQTGRMGEPDARASSAEARPAQKGRSGAMAMEAALW
ncbi:MAG: hypothetical protein ACR2PY_07430 [Salinispira sp.]